ncbi:hypothetical protein [Puia dinghuensis]|uniref:Uncharacterized protein n=1 Tax=Puia dinghuensis TaxID=1792502 RepID=A0A8J2ULQ1_9BACT|nr:hypothetical protein [Puia dinghuensis]GGB26310.1 hypothetical protein GCM10011511_57830 [Puia dinghuensis]
MTKIKIPLLLVALFGIAAAFVNRPQASPKTMHTYNFLQYSTDGTQIYYGMDLTSAGWVDGIDYDCYQPAAVCTFIADPTRSHTDLTGHWFYVSQIPQSGIDNSGTWTSNH